MISKEKGYKILLRGQDGKEMELLPEILPPGEQTVLLLPGVMLAEKERKAISEQLEEEIGHKAVILPGWIKEVVIVPAMKDMGK